MARIRSIHPGLWTDEEFVTLSLPARLFFIGTLNEADDYGILEWRPTRLKMRLAPVDAVDAEQLMEELTAKGFLVKFARNGQHYAAVKNFRKFQRPKNPSLPIIEMDDVLRVIVGLEPSSRPTPALPQTGGRAGEIPPQMEDGGDNREEITAASVVAADENAPPTATSDVFAILGKLGAALPCEATWRVRNEMDISPILAAMQEGADFNLDVLPAVAEVAKTALEKRRTIGRWSYFADAIRDHHKARTAANAVGSQQEAAPISDAVWQKAVGQWKRDRSWPFRESTPPDDPETKVPRHILDALGVRAAA
jgi:hypothetical protein